MPAESIGLYLAIFNTKREMALTDANSALFNSVPFATADLKQLEKPEVQIYG